MMFFSIVFYTHGDSPPYITMTMRYNHIQTHGTTLFTSLSPRWKGSTEISVISIQVNYLYLHMINRIEQNEYLLIWCQKAWWNINALVTPIVPTPPLPLFGKKSLPHHFLSICDESSPFSFNNFISNYQSLYTSKDQPTEEWICL